MCLATILLLFLAVPAQAAATGGPAEAVERVEPAAMPEGR